MTKSSSQKTNRRNNVDYIVLTDHDPDIIFVGSKQQAEDVATELYRSFGKRTHVIKKETFLGGNNV